MYSDLQSKIETLGGDLKAKVNVALEDGVITLDEQAEITNLQNQIATSRTRSARRKRKRVSRA